ncbi:MAG: PilZ domain-containing protein [Deltaproteobacteria bacterium]|jgi:Tfp pilus assembly protein PilZ|nr:PilZ domain-containing protein [Deltaproteobacteria bacterium]
MVQKSNVKDGNVERRRHGRTNFEALISHEILTDDEIHTGKMYNFSRSGLYFESDQTIFRGDEILIKVLMLSHDPDSYEQFPIDVEIIWQRDLKASAYKYGYGGRYVLENEYIDNGIQEIESEEQGLADHQIEDRDDPREHPRKIHNQSLLIRYKDQIHRGFIKNISLGGALIETRGDFLLGTTIELIISEGKVKKKMNVKGRVVRFSPRVYAVNFARAPARHRRKQSTRHTIGPPATKGKIDSRPGGASGDSNEKPFEF